MELLVGLLLAAGAGWVVWSMITPPELFRVTVRNGQVRITGRLPAQTVADIEEFFRANFPDERSLRVSVSPPSASFRSRIHVAGTVSAAEKQMIRNFLLTRI